MTTRLIIHVDMDAFYASVEVLDNPRLAGAPVIVGGAGNRGVVCSASYEARKFGVRSAQPIVTARKLCGKGVFLPVRMQRYKEVSERIHAVFHRFTPLVEPLSLDEAFLDVTRSMRLFGSGEKMAADIRAMISSEIGITASAGVAENKLIAKIASDLCKPDGLLVVPPGTARGFLAPLPISRLWGVGPAAVEKLRLLGVKTMGDASRLSLSLLRENFGKFGDVIHDFSRGLDSREVEPFAPAKSIGRETTFERDVTSVEEARRRLLHLSERVARRLRLEQVMGRTICLKVKYADFTQVTRSVTVEAPTDDPGVIFRQATRLVEKTMIGKKPVRLLGVSLSHLAGPGEAWQPGLFEDKGAREKRKQLHQAMDRICSRFGTEAVGPASLVPEPDATKQGKKT